MAPAVFINVGLEAFGHARLFSIFRDVAPRAGHAGGSAAASLGSVPRMAGMGLANPTAIVAEGAFHLATFCDGSRSPRAHIAYFRAVQSRCSRQA
jgi:hypothetical protein